MLEVTITQLIPEDGWTRTERITGVFEDYTDVGMMLRAMASRFKMDLIEIKEVKTEPVEMPDDPEEVE